MQKVPFFGSSVTENTATAVFLGAFLKTSVNCNSGWWKKRQLSFHSTARTAGGSGRPGAAKTPGLSPAFSSSPVFSAFCWGGFLNPCLNIPPQMVHNGLLGLGGAGSCPAWQGGHKPARRGLHGGLYCEAGSDHIQLQFSELPLVKKNPLQNGWGESCRDCCLSTSFHVYQNNYLAPQR